MLPKCHDTMDVVELDKRYRHREDAVGSPKESYTGQGLPRGTRSWERQRTIAMASSKGTPSSQQSFGLLLLEGTHFCCLSYPVCRALLWQGLGNYNKT